MSDGILSRWARRKQAVRAAERAEAPRSVQLEELEVTPLAEAPAHTPEEADALAEMIARLPKLEDVTAQTDLTQFLRAGIPSALRNAALRRMWSVDPAIRDFVSEAREYAYDWNTPGGVPGLGPMLPTDDIKAMVERVMTGHAPAAVPAETVAEKPVSDLRDGPIAIDETLPSEPSPVSNSEPSRETSTEATPIAETESGFDHAETPGFNPQEDLEPTFQSPTIVSRLRRHGGAMPS